ncbi:DNA-binding HxlR family transcriptional regulator [Symbiobacterium terraclitae]|uniref:DNA-binding HxlR family transcriptional regulator n=1 Tax=Symbiobacterium terraclitae TaxID=557451 RepID=A0ABS4JR58_9FIRM|nr:helix-turn-helix domain-containing protein [Symbiobacterium terraclitae]MBP2018014.1 DNA-binding HxlR family transcriptional regulator [Symbiobacterium terraclitae]
MADFHLCPKFEHAIQLLGKRWTGLILSTLLSGPKRFSEIESAIPVSGRLLSERLKELESEGLVTREVFPEVPVRVVYSLTPKGKAMEPVLAAVQQWAERWA